MKYFIFTKEKVKTMHFVNFIKKTVICQLLIMVFLLCSISNVQSTYAATLSYYNYNSNTNVNYNGKQVNYVCNNKKINLTNPGILVNGTAMADYEELFVNELGLTAQRTEDSITLTDGETVLTLTVGSKKVLLNNQKQSMSVAPIKLNFNNKIQYYVPTRFIAEAFGFNYVWDSVNSTAKITQTYLFKMNQKTILYNNTLYTASYNKTILGKTTPIIFYNGCVLISANELSAAVNGNYNYKDSHITIEKEDISIQMELNSDVAIINGFTFYMDGEPLVIQNQRSKISTIYIPMEFVVRMLGFELSYQDVTCHFTIQNTSYIGNAEQHPELKPLYLAKSKAEEQLQPLNSYFTWEAPVQESNKNISMVKAYAVENADVLEIYGISRKDIYDFLDGCALVFELKSVTTSLDTQFFVDFSTPHLNYALMTTINNNTKFFFMIPYDSHWEFVDKEGYVQVFFMKENLSLEDLKISSEEPVMQTEPATQQYPKNNLVFPLPDNINNEDIQVNDNYLNYNFQVILSGNYQNFYEKNLYYNPYDFIDNIDISYNDAVNKTIITCHTSEIYGFTYEIKNDYLSFSIGKPWEIFNKIVVLDAGHGGKDPGAVRNKIYEKDINFDILYTYTKSFFENSDIKVYYTRESDKFISLNDRAKFASLVQADLFISLHMNASIYEEATGTEVFYSVKNNDSQASGLTSAKFAKILAPNVSNALNTKLRGVSKSDYYVVQYNSVPAILIELGFISNAAERSKLVNPQYQKKVAEAIYQSIIEVFCAYPTGR